MRILFLLIFFIPLKSFAILNIECTTNFPCQEELKPKIEFWVKVFHDYTQNQAIFHDAEAPEVIYSVITSDTYCSQRKSGPIEQERVRIRGLLKSIQEKQSQGVSTFTSEEQPLVTAIKASKSFELDKASERIRCQNGIREQFEKALSRYRYYKDDVVQILKDSSLPEDIQYLPFVESSYNPMAYSKVGAAGLWQIMPQTARVLGLKINASIDERLDPVMATKAAARYFENSYQTMLQTSPGSGGNDRAAFLGPFVITSYNYGIAGMKKALEAHGSNFMDVLNNYKGKSFRVAVKNFYASFIAAKHLVKNESHYFQKIEPYQFPQYNVLNVPKNISAMKFAQSFNIPIDSLRELNPVLTKRVWSGVHPIPQNFQLKIPHHHSADSLSKDIAAMSSDDIEVKIKNYQVQRGDFPCTIARTFEVPCGELMAANGLTGRGMIRVGQILSIPTKETKVASNNKKLETTTPKPSSSKPKQSILVMDEPTKPVETPKPAPETPTQTPPQVAAIETPSSPEALPPASTVPPTTTTIPDNQDWLLVFKSKGNNPNYYIHVEAEETLGHYSDWIEGTTTQAIRNLNKMDFGKALTVGQKIILPIKSDDQKGMFEKKRVEYHQTLEEGFDDQYSVIAFTTYQVKKGDNEWTISTKLQIPMWIIKKYNPTLVQKDMRVGDNLNIPLLKDKTQSEPPMPQQEVPPPSPVS